MDDCPRSDGRHAPALPKAAMFTTATALPRPRTCSCRGISRNGQARLAGRVARGAAGSERMSLPAALATSDVAAARPRGAEAGAPSRRDGALYEGPGPPQGRLPDGACRMLGGSAGPLGGAPALVAVG